MEPFTARVHEMKLRPSPFDMIASRHKQYELRLWDEKRQRICPGDTIIFIQTETGERLYVNVISIHHFASFEELYEALPADQIGYSKETAHLADPEDMRSYYDRQEEADYGVVAIKIAL